MATPSDIGDLVALHARVAERLSSTFGAGRWAHPVGEGAVRRAIATSRVVVARAGSDLVGTLVLATKKPWAIDLADFTPTRKGLYLLDMAVDPDRQRRGIGRQLLEEARRLAIEAEVGALRLDAWDAPAGAGGFYAKCGFREVGRKVYRGVPLVYFERLL